MSEVLISSEQLSSEQKLTVTADFLNRISTGMILRDVRGVIIDANDAAIEILGTTREKLIDSTSTGFEGHVVRLDGSPYVRVGMTSSDAALPGHALPSGVVGIVAPDGREKWLSLRVWPAEVDGEIVGMLSAFDDVTRDVNEQRFLDLLNHLTALGDTVCSEADALEQICSLIVRDGHYALAWIGVAGAEGEVEIVATAGESDYLFDGVVTWKGSKDTGLGPTGVALRTGTTQVANDLGSLSLYGPWRERAASFHLSSGVSLPVTLGNRRGA
ncbi:MAG TPA: PAS domain-containing protein, partial [Acidimicrobiales bacterium]